MTSSSLANFKKAEDETRERVYVICEDPRALKVLAVWSETAIHYTGKSATRNRKPAITDSWEQVWDDVEIDHGKLVTMTGLDDKVVRSEVERLRLLRLIYPDGTMHKAARDVLRHKIASKLGVKKKAGTDQSIQLLRDIQRRLDVIEKVSKRAP